MANRIDINDKAINGSETWIHSRNAASKKVNIGSGGDTLEPDCLDNEYDYDGKSCSSEDSEIANLANVTISDGAISFRNADDEETDAKIQDEVTKIIETVKLNNATSVDLSKKNLKTFPDALSQLSNLEYIYLEGNKLLSLPEDFFKLFPHVRWLDLRNNLLRKIPTAYLAYHTCLRNILLEGNNLHNLPLELGLVKSLHGLNIACNPLDFPPQEIIEKGTLHIKSFLKDQAEKKALQTPDLELNLSEKLSHELEHVSASSDDWNTTASMMDLAKKREAMLKNKSYLNGNPQDHSFAAKLVNVHKSANNVKTRYQDVDKIWKSGESNGVDNNLWLIGSSNFLRIKQANILKRASSEGSNAFVHFFKSALKD